MPLYMDHHATTPVDRRVLERMLPFFDREFGNAASREHAFGWRADEAVEDARVKVQRLLGAHSHKEIVFTSGATESDNLAIKGVAHAYRDRGDHLVTVRTEHKAVLDSMRRLEREGFSVTYLDVDAQGRVDPAAVERAIGDRTILVSVMLANNEIGVVQDIGAIGRVTRARNVLFHCDAVQGLGLVPFDVEAMQVDLASVSAHKLYGPKGAGALYVRKKNPRVRLIAELDGGGHERGLRSGTLNVPGIVGLGAACELAREEGPELASRLARLRDRLHATIAASLDGVHLNGPPSGPARAPNNLNLSFDGLEGEALLVALAPVVALSSGAACTSASVEPSYVLRALGRSKELADASLRFGLGRSNDDAAVELVAAAVVDAVKKLRA
jgi:cysteine desulfurase